MPVTAALNAYKAERLNCAQSILRAFQQHVGLTEEDIRHARQFGGGRAAEGRCGALHAAMELAPTAEVAGELERAFTASAGSARCREIRASRTLTCAQCVELAAALLADAKERPHE